jgi:hypothetical protein
VSDAIGQIVQSLLNFITPIVSPDWGALVGMIPVLLVIGVIGPLVTLLVLLWFVYFVAKPRYRQRYVEPEPIRAPVVDGSPAYPTGEPYCPFDQLILPPGSTRCPSCGRDLAVVCPKCGTGRAAYLDTCGTCGLVLKIEPTARALRPAGPPPGGAAAA